MKTQTAKKTRRTQPTREDILYRTKWCQMIFHTLMTTLAWTILPENTLMNPIEASEHDFRLGEQTHKPFSVACFYMIALAYNTLLYFSDPVESLPFRWYHALLIGLGPLWSTGARPYWLLGLLACTYVLDWRQFLRQFAQGPSSSARLRVMTRVHHMATLMLLVVSWTFHYHYYGCFLMFLHDITDVPMFAIRLLRSSSRSPPLWPQLVVVPILLAMWTYYRIYLLGDFVGRALGYLSGWSEQGMDLQHIEGQELSSWVCVAGLTVLWTFNVYWTALVAQKTAWTLWHRSHAQHDDNE